MRSGPESELIKDYLSRFERTGRPLGLGPVSVHEVEAKKSAKAGEAELLTKAIAGLNPIIVLDERGQTLTSPQFADRLALYRDQGHNEIALLIGGADGIDAGLKNRADLAISFGRMVWPHMLARVMLAEQLYRAASILAGGPYHRV